MFWKRLLSIVIVGSGGLAAQAAPPTPDFANLPAYIRALNQSHDPQAVAIRREIADGPAALARERAACEADGISLDPKSLQPSVPSDQNAAPLWDKWNTLRHGHLQLPNYAETLRFGYSYTPEQLARVQTIFDDNREAMDVLHQAADKPAYAFTYQGFGGFGHYADLREAARELKTESYLLATQGRYAEAVTDQARGFNIAKQTVTRPTLINYLVGDAIEAITLSGLRDILYLAGPNTDVSAQVPQAIQAARPVLSLKSALAGEVAYSLSLLDTIRDAPPAALATLAPGTPSRTATSVKTFTPEQQQFVGNLLAAAEADYLSQMRRLVDVADEPGPKRRAMFAAIEVVPGEPPLSPIQRLSPIRQLSEMILPVYSPTDEIDSKIHVQEELTLAAAALMAERARTGKFPDALPDGFSDPFNSKPLGYRREGDDGFVVYSVGADGKFDGGKPGQYEFHPPQVFFRFPAPPLQPLPPDQQ